MTSSPDVASSSDAAPSSSSVIALVVLGSDPSEVAAALSAAAGERPFASFVVGGGSATKRAAVDGGATWVGNLTDLTELLPDQVTHVWFLHSDCRPRPGAMAALITEAMRVDASVAGSKVLSGLDASLLESVGGATDVFGHPYSGLTAGEVDQEQYDVVRDVAFVPAVSVMIRRDLFKGLKGPDLNMAPGAQGVDLAQRARLLGGRVVVVPSSEVFHDRTCAEGIPDWRERAGEIRAVAKAYRPITLLWVLPFSAVIGLVAGMAQLVMGRLAPLVGEAKAWLWNAKNLGSTIRGRRGANQARRVGDEELFRYQASGSLLLRQTGEDFTGWLRKRSHPDGALGSFLARRRGFWQEPGFVATGVAVVLALVATRALWASMPVTGFRLNPAADWQAVLNSYAGAWNPSGFGSTEPLRPAVVVLTLAQAIGFSPAVLTFGSMLGGFVGTLRLLRTWGLADPGRVAGGFVAGFGPALLALGDAGQWHGIVAAGLLPWAVDAASRPLSGSMRYKLGRIGSGVLVTGIMAALVPWLAIVPALAFLMFSLVAGSVRWALAGRAVAFAVGAATLISPWLIWVAPSKLLTVGDAVWWSVPAWFGLGFVALALASLMLAAKATMNVIATGTLLALVGILVGRAEFVGAGLELSVAGMVVAVLGMAAAVGGVVTIIDNAVGGDRARRLGSWAVALAMIVLVAIPAALPIVRGRAGLEADDFGVSLAFTGPRSDPQGPDRILFIGEGAPGQSRRLVGVPYRVMSADLPLTEAWLPGRGPGDVALEETLLAIRDPQRQRPGLALAEFGIRWVVVLEPNPLEAAFQARLDMRRLALFDVPFVVYENLESSPRAFRDDGVIWSHDGFGYFGPPADTARVQLTEQFDEGWGPESIPEGWGTSISATDGVSSFEPQPFTRLLAWLSGVVAVAAAFLGVYGVGGKRR